jgi:hypothetical protein
MDAGDGHKEAYTRREDWMDTATASPWDYR